MSLFIFLIHLVSAELTEPQIVGDVLSQFPVIQMSQQELKVAEGQELSARGNFDIVLEGDWKESTGNYENSVLDSRIKKPTSIFGLDLYAGFRKSQGDIPVYYGEDETLDRGEWNVGLNLPLLRGFYIDKRRAEFYKSELQVSRKSLQLRATELKEIEKALFAFWNWKVALERWRIQKELLDIAQSRDQWLEKRAKAGDIAEFERKDNLRTILVRKSALLQADVELKAREMQLNVFITDANLKKNINTSLQPNKNIEARWPIPTHMLSLLKPVNELVNLAIKERPEFAEIATELSQLEIEKDLQKNQFLPKLDFKAEYSKDRGIGSPKLNDDNTTLGLQLQLPLQYRSIRGQNNQISANIKKVELERQLLERQWRAELETLQKNLSVAYERRELSLEEYSLAQQLEKGERLRFRQGDTNVLIVNLREQASAEASLRVVETTAEVLRTYAALEVRVGKIPFLK